MANHCAVTIPLEDIERIEIYINKTPRKTLATIKKNTGADFILNGTLYDMKTGDVCCHLKADGKHIHQPDYSVNGYAWDTGSDIAMMLLPAAGLNTPTARKQNWIACTPLIVGGKKVDKPCKDPARLGKRGRSAIGIRKGCLAMYCTKDGTAAARDPETLRDDLYSAGWDSAVMLDGGGSSQCDFLGDKVTSSRKVQHLILVYLKPTVCPYTEPTTLVKSGSIGEGAKWVQWQLNRHGANLVVDGIFGAKSVAALKKFQQSVFPNNPKEWDGICGAKTRKELLK